LVQTLFHPVETNTTKVKKLLCVLLFHLNPRGA
jgi:hypothetical protein